jgi:glycosyltransferase involved in cell wall biosynthesis
MIKVLHIIKTPVGATWALQQIEVLRKLGVEITVLLPPGESPTAPIFKKVGCKVIRLDMQSYRGNPLRLTKTIRNLREIIISERPDIIHSHFYETTAMMRLALRDNCSIPRIFQVAGPLHLEYRPFRDFEKSLSGKMDYWIGSSRCIIDHYLGIGIPKERLFLSYYGFKMNQEGRKPSGILHKAANIGEDDFIVGNVGWMYAPKYYLGHTRGIKRHEDIIDALGVLIKHNPSILGIFVGGAWNNAGWYEEKLKKRAKKVAGERIVFTGPLSYDEAQAAWQEYHLAVHVPISENCGGVVEPLYHSIPILASNVGGIPEVVIEGKTGYLITPGDKGALVRKVEEILRNPMRGKIMAELGSRLVNDMFNVERTAREVYLIYRHILDVNEPRPAEYNSGKTVATLEK